MVAVIAHALAVIRKDIFGGSADPAAAAAAALFHDASEILTGDMPTPVKYHNYEINTAYKQVEQFAEQKLLTTLPEQMKPAYASLLQTDDDTHRLIKAADTLSAYIKCLEELRAGNAEFRSAATQTKRKLHAMQMPEVEYFMENFIPSFELTLDELDF